MIIKIAPENNVNEVYKPLQLFKGAILRVSIAVLREKVKFKQGAEIIDRSEVLGAKFYQKVCILPDLSKHMQSYSNHLILYTSMPKNILAPSPMRNEIKATVKLMPAIS